MATVIHKISSYVVWNSKQAVLPLGVVSNTTINNNTTSTPYHNDLLGLQGGQDTSYEDSNGIMGEYYHLDASSYFALLPLVDDSVVGNSKYYGTNDSGVKGFNSFPIASASVLGMIKVGTGLSIDSNGILSAAAGMVYPAAGIPLSTGSAWGTSITDNSANWNTAYGWGNHADAGYVTGAPWADMGYASYPYDTGIVVTTGSSWDTSIPLANIPVFSSAITGTPNSTTYLRGDGSWQTLATTNYWQRVGIIVSPATSGDTISTSGTGYFSGSGSKLDLRIGTTKYLAIDTSLNNIRIGAAAGNDSMSTNGDNILIGRQAGYSMTSASVNSQLIGIGYLALRSFTTGGSWAICIGPYAGNAFTSGDITAIGNWAARYSTSNCLGVTAIGHFALCDSVTGSSNTTAIGSQALYHAVSANSVAIGAYAGRGVSGQTTGDNNVFIGAYVASLYTTGTENVRIGSLMSWDTLTSGSYNTTIGRYAGKVLTGGSNNTLLGWQAGVSLSSGSRNLILGYNVDAPSLSTNDYLAIGYATTKLLEGSVASGSEYLKSNYQFQTIASTATKAGFRIAHGTAPSAPVNGDIWTTTSGLYARINGATVGPYGVGGGTSYTFQYSLTESAGAVNLVNDSATPGNNKYYGTNSSGTKGFFDLPSGGGGGITPVDSTLLDWSTDRYIAYATKQAGGDFYSDGNTLPTATTILNYNGCFVATAIDAVGDIMAGGGTGFGAGANNIFLEKSAAKISITYSSVELCHLHPAVTNGSTAIAYYYNTIASLTIAGAKLASWQNNSVEKVAIDKDGNIYATQFINAYAGVGDSVILSHDAEVNTSSTSYVKLKTITLGSNMQVGRTMRIKFDLHNSTAGFPAYGRIYRNSVAVGTEQLTTSVTYDTFSEDISGWGPGDTIELWVKAITGYTAYVENFKLCGIMSTAIINEVTGSNS
jgi:hypothetical protein